MTRYQTMTTLRSRLLSAALRPHALALACATLYGVSSTVLAAPPPPTTPGAGQFLQEAQPPANATPNNNTGLTVQTPSGAAITDTTPIPVSRFEITGNTRFDDATLHALVADGEGRTLTLGEIYGLAQRITDHYHQRGYLLAQAIIPAQSVDQGTVRIEIIEARFGRVRVNNRSRVDTGLLLDNLSSLHTAAVVQQDEVDHALLLLSDIPGAQVHATLAPGQEPGTSDLTVQVDRTPMLTGQAGVDNEGDRYTGRARGTVSLALNNLLHWGDILSLDAMTTGEGMTWAKIGYSLSYYAGISYSALGYHLGGNLADLGGHGTADVTSVWGGYPFIRSKTLNLSAKLEYDHRRLDDEIDAADISDRRHLDVFTLSLSGDHSDDWLGGGMSRASLSATQGNLGYDNDAAQLADGATSHKQGNYTLWSGGINRLQRITGDTQLYLSLSHQHSSKNVDSSEQWLLGGPGTLRGYPVSTLSGSSGSLETLELRHEFPVPVLRAIQASAFFDAGQVTINADPWAPGENHANLMSAGIGLDWSAIDQWDVKVQVADPVGRTPELAGPRPSTQVWAQLSKGFGI